MMCIIHKDKGGVKSYARQNIFGITNDVHFNNVLRALLSHNNSKIMAGLRTKAAYRPGAAGSLGGWRRNFLVMAGGPLFVTPMGYIPSPSDSPSPPPPYYTSHCAP